MNKILIVDGSNLLFQMFYGMPARIVNKEGRPIQGILGFTGALLKIIRMVKPTHIAVLFDGETNNPRKDIDESYKANRPDFSQMEEEDTPFSQLADIYTALDYLNISHKETCDCEADDWISAYAEKYHAVSEIIISSFDSDFFQLISENVGVLRYRGDSTVICTPKYINEKFGIEPWQYADFKSLTGDTADNIKGAEGVGPKTAAELLRQFKTLEGVLENAENIAKLKVSQSIKTSKERLLKNYKLIKLRGECEVPFSLSEMEYTPNDISTTEVLKAIGVK